MPSTLQRIPAPPSKRNADAMEPTTLIDRLLAEQSTLQTPVARFSEVHDNTPDLADHYRSLIPLTKPGSNEQYAFEVALDRCTGCKACVSACHSLNGLDKHEAWRDAGTLLGGGDAPAWQQTITTACHHCGDPACMNGCPVGAYEKDDDTGIVRHLDDQCIGCSYCILKCPYDVPKFSAKRGIVRKCDMCHQRLAEGEAPACVQACPTEAIRIVTVPKPTSPASLFASGTPAPESAVPSSSITLPTTRYTGRPVPASAVSADRETLVTQHAHWPLVLMLTLTQAGAGLAATAAADSTPVALLVTAAALFNTGMIAAVFHLGQPLKAWRFFLGLRTSWLSREILAFSLYAPIPLVLCALPLLPDFPFKPLISTTTAWSALPVGLLAIFTSVMIYADTRRTLWRLPLTAIRFFGTAAAFLVLGWSIENPAFRPLAAALITAKALPELRLLLLATGDRPWSPDRHSARLMLGPLQTITITRFTLAALAAFLVCYSPWLALPVLLAADLLERQLFFQAVQAPKMPGNFGPPNPH